MGVNRRQKRQLLNEAINEYQRATRDGDRWGASIARQKIVNIEEDPRVFAPQPGAQGVMSSSQSVNLAAPRRGKLLRDLFSIAVGLIAGFVGLRIWRGTTPSVAPGMTAPTWISTLTAQDWMVAATGFFLLIGVIGWVSRGGRSPRITRDTTRGQMVGRAGMATIAGILLVGTLLCMLVGVAQDWDANPEHLEEFSADVHTALEPTGWWEMSVEEHGNVILLLLPIVVIVGLAIGWGFGSLFI